jgi:hypothetical protein
MASDSALHVPTQQSVKAYVDTGTTTMSNKTLISPVLNGSLTGTGIKDEDDMASDSSTALATQQSIKAYVDTFVGVLAYQSTLQSIATVTWTKVLFQTEVSDPQGVFASSTLTPTKAGNYLVVAAVTIGSITANQYVRVAIYKNGTLYKIGPIEDYGVATNVTAFMTGIVPVNGTTDTIEIYVLHNNGSNRDTLVGQAYTFFDATFVGA